MGEVQGNEERGRGGGTGREIEREGEREERDAMDWGMMTFYMY